MLALRLLLVYSRCIPGICLIILFREIWRILFIIIYDLMHLRIVGRPHNKIPLFSMFYYGMEFDHFTRVLMKFNSMNSITKLVNMLGKRYDGWRRW